MRLSSLGTTGVVLAILIGCQVPASKRADPVASPPAAVASPPAVVTTSPADELKSDYAYNFDDDPLAPASPPLPEMSAAAVARAAKVRRRLSVGGQEAFDAILKARVFGGDAVGYSGRLSAGAAAVRRLIREPEALEAFDTIFDHGGVVGQLYALCAFWYLRPAEFPALVRKVQVTQGETLIDQQGGCIKEAVSVREFLTANGEGLVRLAPGSSRWDLMCPLTDGTSTFDIVGGAVPISIVQDSWIQADECDEPRPPLPEHLRRRSLSDQQ